jgi:DNA-binding IclR family transcriptional regulator
VRKIKKEDRLAFILRGKNRMAIYFTLLNGIFTPTEICRLTNIWPSNVSRVLKDLKKYSLVENTTSKGLYCALYQLTPLALEFKEEFLNHLLYHSLYTHEMKSNFRSSLEKLKKHLP